MNKTLIMALALMPATVAAQPTPVPKPELTEFWSPVPPMVAPGRMPGDAFVSAFVLFELGENGALRQVARVSDAIDWFAHNLGTLDPDTRRLWDRANAKCVRRHRAEMVAGLWS